MSPTIDTVTSVIAWQEEWKGLWCRENGDPFLHPAWHSAFVEGRQPAVSPLLIGVRLAGELIGLLPMRRDSDGVLRFLTAPNSDYEDALVSAEHGDQAISCLADHLVGERFDLTEVPENSRLAEALRARGIAARPSTPCPGIRLTPDSMKDVTQRKSLVRHARKLSRRGPVTLEAVAPGEVEAALTAMIDQHIARRLVAGDDSLFLDSANRDFYRRIFNHSDFPQFGRFHALKAGTHVAGYHFGLTNGSTFIWYKPTFDLNLQAEGPGEVLLKTLIEEAYSKGATYFDFSRGNEAFKQRFANEQRRNQRLYHRLPAGHTLLNAIKRRSRGVARRARAARRHVASRWLEHKQKKPERVFRIAPAAVHPEPPEGYVFEFGEVDLVAFGALRARIPCYVTSDRMRLAMDRRKNGDRLLSVRRLADSAPVHFSWFRVDAGASIFDSWTAPEARGRGLCTWACRYLAWQAAQLGLPAWVHGLDRHPELRREIENADVVAESALRVRIPVTVEGESESS